MQTPQHLLYEKKAGIACVTINRPKAMNALNRATLEELRAVMEDARGDAYVNGVIVTGAGDKAFVAGADITEIASISAIEAQALTAYGQSTFELIDSLGKPVIAAVNGFAFGGGCELAMACTLRLATPTATFGQPEVKLGVIPGYGGTQRLSRLVGKGRALQIILTADAITSTEAHRIGLVDEIVESAQLMARAEAILARIAANAPLATRLALEAVNKGLEMSMAQGLALESSLFSLCSSTDDKREGTRAFIERRRPNFSGH
jgi:enoyl-CoA hydratase